MEIRQIDKTNFGAKKLRPQAMINVFSTDKNKYLSRKVACVKFDPHDDNDFKVLQNSEKYWISGYAGNISYAAERIRHGKIDGRKHKIFGLTTQQDNFENLDDSKMLLLCEFEHVSKDILHIWHLQVNPKFVYSVKSEFHHIGTGFMDVLKSLFGKIITAKSAYNATGFYEKNGFKIIDTNELLYMFLPEKYKSGKVKLDNR